MYIPDPIELMHSRIESQIDKIVDGKYPCCCCGEYCNPEKMNTVSPDPSSDLICGECEEEEIKRLKQEREETIGMVDPNPIDTSDLPF